MKLNPKAKPSCTFKILGTFRDYNGRMENNLHDGIVQVNVSMIRVHVYMSITALLFECNG